MAAFQKFNSFTTDLTNGKHDFSSHSFKVMLVPAGSPPVATNTIKGNLTEITAGNGYTAGGITVTATKSNASGVEKITFSNDPQWTATGGAMASFRYVVIYNATQTTPASPLVGFYDYTGTVTLNVGESFTVDFDQTNGVFTIG